MQAMQLLRVLSLEEHVVETVTEDADGKDVTTTKTMWKYTRSALQSATNGPRTGCFNYGAPARHSSLRSPYILPAKLCTGYDDGFGGKCFSYHLIDRSI